MNELALFAGAGGGILGGVLLGWRTVCAVECDAYAASVLVARQNDGCLAPFPIWDDVCLFDGRPWRGRVDVVSGGFPCQDISAAGAGAGIEGAKSGLWREMARIVGEVRPRYVLVENSPMLSARGLGVVLGDLAALGYDAEWDVFGAHHVGAPHIRDRIWILAYADGDGFRIESGGAGGPSRSRPLFADDDGAKESMADAESTRLEVSGGASRKSPDLPTIVRWATPTVSGNYNRKGASPTSGDGLATQVGGPLSPQWVEWLMGWPLGWTGCAPLETDRFREWLRSHGAASLEGQE